jgi:hypothetical protein
MIRILLSDLGSPFLFFARIFNPPAKPLIVLIVKLSDFFHAFYESGKFFELCPLM